MPRKTWSDKDERQYEHIKAEQKKRGKSTDRAEEIAARTVNKHRRRQGRTANSTTRGTGHPDKPLAARTKDELYNLARRRNVAGRSRMSKADLVDALRA